jgi:hypothetical protein
MWKTLLLSALRVKYSARVTAGWRRKARVSRATSWAFIWGGIRFGWAWRLL